jgi:hypothetical protein
MKKIIVIIALLFSNLLYGQFNISDELGLQKRPHSRSEYCVQTVHNLLNNSSGFFQMFLQRELDLHQVGEQILNIKDGNGTIESVYMPPIISGNKNIDTDAYKVHVKYYVYAVGNEFFVESLDVYGSWETVAKIFITYYPTTINMEYLSNSKTNITSYYIQDKALFSSYFKRSRLKGKIEVRTTSDKKPIDIISIYVEKKSIYDRKQADVRRRKLAFLKERAATVYSMGLIDETALPHIKNKIAKQLSIMDNYAAPVDDKMSVILKFDTAGNKSFIIQNQTHAYRQEQLMNKLSSISIKAPLLKGYNVATSDTFTFDINYTTNKLTIKKSGRKLKLQSGTANYHRLQNFLHYKHNGIYTLMVNRINIDEDISTDIEIVDYKKRMDMQDFKPSDKTKRYMAWGSGILLLAVLALL